MQLIAGEPLSGEEVKCENDIEPKFQNVLRVEWAGRPTGFVQRWHVDWVVGLGGSEAAMAYFLPALLAW